MSKDLLICIRCHKWPDMVLDTVQACQQFTDASTSEIVCAVDCNPQLATMLEKSLPGKVFNSSVRCGWGPGLLRLLFDSIAWGKQFHCEHFLCLDYDTLFIRPGVDKAVLDKLIHPDLGLVGSYRGTSRRWAFQYEADRKQIEARFGPAPAAYRPGEGVAGAMFVITRAMIEAMRDRGYFPLVRAGHPRSWTRMPEDHFMALLCRYCGLEIKPLGSQFQIVCNLGGNPLAMEKVEGLLAFHPTKVRAECKDPSIEYRVRNHYRQLRGQPPLKERRP